MTKRGYCRSGGLPEFRQVASSKHTCRRKPVGTMLCKRSNMVFDCVPGWRLDFLTERAGLISKRKEVGQEINETCLGVHFHVETVKPQFDFLTVLAHSRDKAFQFILLFWSD